VRTVSARLIVAAFAAVTIGCQKASPTAPGPVDAAAAGFAGAAATVAKATLFTFTKVPAPVGDVSIAPGPDVQIYAFHLDTDRTKDIELTSLSFMISGSLQAGSLSNFRLVFYPSGFGKPGIVVATNDGSAWTPGPSPSNFITLRLAGFVLPQNFRGDFGVLADVGGSSYFFWGQMQTATITVNGVEQPLENPTTCDLPLLGDTFRVN
jgi:hypothetical protein